MKKSNLLFAMAASSLFLAACSDDMGDKHVPAPGEAITFGVSGITTFDNGYSNVPESRTVYGEATYENGTWHYPLNWVEGDKVGIYCPQAQDNKSGYYEIKIDGQDATQGTLMAIEDAGLEWGEGPHTFRAFYPASAMGDDIGLTDGKIINAEIPKEQAPISIEETDNGYIAKPNMQYAFMSAVAENVNPGDEISLDFKPLTTAVDITITAGEQKVRLSNVQVAAVSKDGQTRQSVCGKFTYDITNGHVTLLSDAVNDYRINVPLHTEEGDPVTLSPGQTLTFTVFLLPGSDEQGDRILHNLQVRVPTWEGSTNVKTYENVDIKVSTKSQIILPALVKETEPPYDANTWMASVDDRTYVSQLSIPGASNAFTAEFIKNDNKYGKERVQTQVQTVEQQFKAGVRAFEIAVERWNQYSDPLGSGNPEEHKAMSLATAPLIAGGDVADWTGDVQLNFGQAIQELANLVKEYKTEFVVVMPYYSNNEARRPDFWSIQLKNYLQSIAEGKVNLGVDVIPYRNGITVGDARGKIMFLSRMPISNKECSYGSENGIVVGEPQMTTAIYDWNSDKDRWARRGYDTSDQSMFKEYPEFVDWLCWTGSGTPTKIGEPNWMYDVEVPNNNEGGNVECHIQDWYRVCDEGGYGKWQPSREEKVQDIKDFFAETTETLKDKNVQDIFINSVSGYYIAGDISSATYPTNEEFAKRGDVVSFAADMNNEIYKYILGINNQEIERGPLGIVLINYVNAAQAFGEDVHGDYILHALIDNNFRFLMTGDPNWKADE